MRGGGKEEEMGGEREGRREGWEERGGMKERGKEEERRKREDYLTFICPKCISSSSDCKEHCLPSAILWMNSCTCMEISDSLKDKLG